MKCIQDIKTELVHRASDEAARIMVQTGDYRYAPKWLWKAQKAAAKIIATKHR